VASAKSASSVDDFAVNVTINHPGNSANVSLFLKELLSENLRTIFVQRLRCPVVIKSQLALNVAGQLLHIPRRVAEKAVASIPESSG